MTAFFTPPTIVGVALIAAALAMAAGATRAEYHSERAARVTTWLFVTASALALIVSTVVVKTTFGQDLNPLVLLVTWAATSGLTITTVFILAQGAYECQTFMVEKHLDSTPMFKVIVSFLLWLLRPKHEVVRSTRAPTLLPAPADN